MYYQHNASRVTGSVSCPVDSLSISRSVRLHGEQQPEHFDVGDWNARLLSLCINNLGSIDIFMFLQISYQSGRRKARDGGKYFSESFSPSALYSAITGIEKHATFPSYPLSCQKTAVEIQCLSRFVFWDRVSSSLHQWRPEEILVSRICYSLLT